MARILDALDYAKREKVGTVKNRITKLCMRNGFKQPEKVLKDAVKARIDKGRWIADCDCGGAEAVSRKEPVFYCFSCGNAKHEGQMLTVIFPKNADKVEQEVLKQSFTPGNGKDEISKLLTGKGSRDWRDDGKK